MGDRIIFDRNEDELVKDAIDRLAANIFLQKESTGNKSFALCGCTARANVSMVASELAIALASAGWRTVLVNADLSKKEEAEGKGLWDYCANLYDAFDIISETNYPKLDYICAGMGNESNRISLLCTVRFDALVKYLNRAYDFVIYDTASLKESAGCKLVSAKVDGTILVAALGETMLTDLEKAKEELTRSRDNLVGVVATKMDRQEYKKMFRSGFGGKIKRFFAAAICALTLLGSLQTPEVRAVEEVDMHMGEVVEGSEVIPQVMVTKYTLSKEPIASGDEVELTLTLTNHMEYATAYHIEVLVFAAAGELVMPSGEVNQRYVPQLGPKESVNVSLRMKATERLYTTYASVEIELSYVNQWGYVGTNYSMITPHLLPDSGIRVENLFVPPKAVQGEKTLVTLDYRNIGTRPLHNMSLIPTGKIENSGKPIVMPNLEVNYTDGLDCYLTFQETGMQEVGLRLRYTDDVGNAYEETLPPIMIEVVEQAEKEKKLLDLIKNLDVESLLNEAEQLVMQYRLPLIISGGLLGVILLLLIIRKVFWRRRL